MLPRGSYAKLASAILPVVLFLSSVVSAQPAEYVVFISVDGLSGNLLADLLANDLAGDFANFQRLVDEGATTFNARTDYTHTTTVPNHTSMVTGRPVLQPTGQPDTVHHGYTSNSTPDPTETLHGSGNPNLGYVASVFDVAHDRGLSTALYVSKSKLAIFEYSYDADSGALDAVPPDDGPDKIDIYVNTTNLPDLNATLLADLAAAPTRFSFVHYHGPDSAGHASGWGSIEWNDSVREVDGYLGDLLDTIETNPALDGRTLLILTADHGGSGTGHGDNTDPENYTIPFCVWGSGVAAGADLYALNATSRLDPGATSPDYNVPVPPIRSGDGGNLGLAALGLPPVAGSTMNSGQDLVVTASPPHLLTVRFRDAVTLQPTACRFQVDGPQGSLFNAPDATLLTRSWAPIGGYVHVADSMSLEVEPATYQLITFQGITGIPAQTSVSVQSDTTVTLLLRHWVDARGEGWIGADPHVHAQHGGAAAVYPGATALEAGLAARAEGLDVMFLLENDAAHPGGVVTPLQPGVTLVWGEEYRNGFWGHVVLLDLVDLVLEDGAGCCGNGLPAWPTLNATLESELPPIAIAAHPHTSDDPLNDQPWPGGGYGRELAALALGNRLQGVALASGSNNPDRWAVTEYLDGIIAGARWAATGEGDRALDRFFVPPPGYPRTYALVSSPSAPGSANLADEWQTAFLARKTFATTGPFLRTLTVDGETVGGTLSLSGPATVTVSLSVTSFYPMGRLDLHGAEGSHWSIEWPAGVSVFDTTLSLSMTTDDFVVLDVECLYGDLGSDLPRAVSSPVWIDMGVPWEVPADVAQRGADGLRLFWDHSLLVRGYGSSADSLAARAYVLGAAETYDALDPTPPMALADLNSLPRTTGIGSGGTTSIDLSWSGVDPASAVTLYRRPFGNYPYYDNLPNAGSVPTIPADPSAAAAEGWTAVTTVSGASGAVDDPPTRDFWYHVGFVTDTGGDVSAPSNLTTGALNYHLGDVTDGVTPGSGDNLVNVADISALGSRYGEFLGPSDEDGHLDVGPTHDFSITGRPQTDGWIEFEDLILYSINFAAVSKQTNAQQPALSPRWAPQPAPANVLTQLVPDLPATGETVAITLRMAGDGRAQGLSIALDWDRTVLEWVGVESGELLAAQSTTSVVLSPRPGTVDVALLGIQAGGISGHGALANVVFRVLGGGDPNLRLEQVFARDGKNQPLEIRTDVTTIGAPELRLPETTMLYPNVPNPFNPVTTISFDIGTAGWVSLEIYATNGRHVRTLVGREYAAGHHRERWNGTDDSGSRVASGTYAIQLKAPGATRTQLMRLVR